jgi:hypothetical protein
MFFAERNVDFQFELSFHLFHMYLLVAKCLLACLEKCSTGHYHFKFNSKSKCVAELWREFLPLSWRPSSCFPSKQRVSQRDRP